MPNHTAVICLILCDLVKTNLFESRKRWFSTSSNGAFGPGIIPLEWSTLFSAVRPSAYRRQFAAIKKVGQETKKVKWRRELISLDGFCYASRQPATQGWNLFSSSYGLAQSCPDRYLVKPWKCARGYHPY